MRSFLPLVFAAGLATYASWSGPSAPAAECIVAPADNDEPPGTREHSRWNAARAPAFVRLGYDDACLNLAVYRAEDGVWRCWEGTLAETWRLDQAGTLLLQ